MAHNLQSLALDEACSTEPKAQRPSALGIMMPRDPKDLNRGMGQSELYRIAEELYDTVIPRAPAPK